jgi:hypothetical protein
MVSPIFLTSSHPENTQTNIGNSFKISGVYSPNLYASKSPEPAVLGGWTFSGIMNYHTGFPNTHVFNPTQGALTSFSMRFFCT